MCWIDEFNVVFKFFHLLELKNWKHKSQHLHIESAKPHQHWTEVKCKATTTEQKKKWFYTRYACNECSDLTHHDCYLNLISLNHKMYITLKGIKLDIYTLNPHNYGIIKLCYTIIVLYACMMMMLYCWIWSAHCSFCRHLHDGCDMWKSVLHVLHAKCRGIFDAFMCLFSILLFD